MTLRSFTIGQGVLVRGTIADALAHSAIVRIPTAKKHAGEFPLVEILTADIFLGPSTDEACAVLQLFIQRLERLHEIGLRLQAEIYELAGHAQLPPRGTNPLANQR